MDSRTASRVSVTLASILAGALAAPALADYSFKVDGNGKPIKIWWTDDKGNRIGDPLYEGTLQVGEQVGRSTTSPSVYDHSLKETDATSGRVGFNDVHWGATPLAITNIQGPITIPTLFDYDPAGGNVSVFYVVDLSVWAASGGVHVPGLQYSGFLPNGTHPLLPGYTVGWSNDPNMVIEDAFSMDFLTGEVGFAGAQPFHAGMGSLVTSSSITATPAPGTFVLLGAGAMLSMRRRRA